MLLAGFAAQPLQAQNDRSFEIAKNLEIFSSVYKQLNLNYVDDVDPGKAIKVAIDAMLASFDPYTNYFPESDIEDVKLQLLGEYGGVGAIITQRGDSVYISEPYKGLPADEAGLKAGDRIVAVNGESTKGKKVPDVSSAMRGQAGTQVTLRVEREGKEFERTLTRREIKLPNVPYYGYVGPKGDVGYIKLDEFTNDAAKNVREAFVKLKKDKPGMKGRVITVLKRAARKSMRFYIEPICEQQTELNHLFACGFRQFTLAFTDMRPDIAKMDDHEDRIIRLEKLAKVNRARQGK